MGIVITDWCYFSCKGGDVKLLASNRQQRGRP